MNHVTMLGRLCKEPEIRRGNTNGKGYVVAGFFIAVDRRFQKDKTDFFNCTAFGKTAEFIEKYISKGNRIAIGGSLQNEQYEKDGKKLTSTKIIVDEIDFADSKKEPEKSEDDVVSIPEGIEGDLPFK